MEGRPRPRNPPPGEYHLRMASKQVALDAAAFLDSPQARALAAPRREEIRRIAEIFLTLCYDDLGKKPRFLDGHDVHTILGHLMPGRLKRKDPLGEHVPAVLDAFFDHLVETQIVGEPFEIRNALAGTVDEFLEAVRTGRSAHHAHAAQETVVHRAPKLGRNDPCFCGSGKKFKKCHGKSE